MSPVKLAVPLILITALLLGITRGVAVALWVSTMNGSKVVPPPPLVLIVVATALVPHQSSVALTVVPPFLRLLPTPVAEFPARRLNVIVRGPAAGKAPALPLEIPPPLPVAVLPVMVTWVRVASQVNPTGQLAGGKLLT